MSLYVVAVSQKEAFEIARDRPDVCHTKKSEAEAHLKKVQAPPTDSFYASQYRVYTVTQFSGSRVPSNTIPASTPGDVAK